jgi:hypothetical protein
MWPLQAYQALTECHHTRCLKSADRPISLEVPACRTASPAYTSGTARRWSGTAVLGRDDSYDRNGMHKSSDSDKSSKKRWVEGSAAFRT